MQISLRRRPLAIAGVGAAAVCLLLASGQQTGALWRSQQTISAPALTSGTLDITVGAGGTSSDSFTFAGFGKTNMRPGDFVQRPLTVRNAGNVTMDYRLDAVTQTSAAVSLTLTATLVATEGACTAVGTPTGTGLYSGPMVGAQAPAAPAFRRVAVNGSDVWCLRATAGANQTNNATTKVTLSFLAQST